MCTPYFCLVSRLSSISFSLQCQHLNMKYSDTYIYVFFSKLTPDIQTGSRQDVPLVVVTNQIIPGLLPGGIERSQRDAEVGRAQNSVERAWQLLTVEGPEQRAGMDTQVRVDPAAGCQVGPHAQDGVLGVDDGYI